jgi:hypothetical protein
MNAQIRLKLVVLVSIAALLMACSPKTVVVRREALAPTRVVKETVVVKEVVEVEKEVTKVVEKEVERVSGEPGKASYQPTLSAGMVDDNQKWDDYLLYRINSAGIADSSYVHDRDVSERYVVSVQDRDGYPVLGAKVHFSADQREIFVGRTHATGRVFFFPKALGTSDDVQVFGVSVTAGGDVVEDLIFRDETYELTVVVDTASPHNFEPALQVLFLLDSTGSMSDEIDVIKSNIRSIASEIATLGSVSDIRFGLTLYRDRGDVYVTRTYDFAPVSEFAHLLSSVDANGGGDTPESVNEGLHEAIHAPHWREDAVRLIIWVGDAPPHMDYEQDYDYAVEMEQAARKGIKVFAIAASGLDAYGEYIWRQVAQFTEGKFVFLTYGDASESSPGTKTKHHVDDYSVENLDALIVRLVIEELAWQTEA